MGVFLKKDIILHGGLFEGGGLICKNDFLVGAYLRGEGLIRAWGLIRGLAVPLFYLIEMRGEIILMRGRYLSRSLVRMVNPQTDAHLVSSNAGAVVQVTG